MDPKDILLGILTLIVFGGAIALYAVSLKRGLARAKVRSEGGQRQQETYKLKDGKVYYTPDPDFWKRLRHDNPDLPEQPPTQQVDVRIAWKPYAVFGSLFLGAALIYNGLKMGADLDWIKISGGVTIVVGVIALVIDHVLRAQKSGDLPTFGGGGGPSAPPPPRPPENS